MKPLTLMNFLICLTVLLLSASQRERMVKAELRMVEAEKRYKWAVSHVKCWDQIHHDLILKGGKCK